ncbi:hypothetical protein GCM10028832_20570 [Streptomyces sparsus]
MRNDTEAAPRCSLSMSATTSSDSTGAADSAAASVLPKVIVPPRPRVFPTPPVLGSLSPADPRTVTLTPHFSLVLRLPPE